MAAVRTLIVLGSSLTGLAVARVARRKDIECIMLDTASGPACHTWAASFRRLDAPAIAAIDDATRDVRPDAKVAVVADSDRWLRFVRDVRDNFVARGWHVLHPKAEAIDICLDKTAFLKWCVNNDLPAPRSYEAAHMCTIDVAEYPLMLRPEQTQHSSPMGLPKAIEVSDAGQLQYWLKRFHSSGVVPAVCESLLRPGLRQFSVGAARDESGRTVTFVAEKIRPGPEQCAGGTFVAPAYADGIAQLASRALSALGFIGIGEVEVLYDPASERSWLIEINARPWLQYALPFKCGCDLLAHALGVEEARGNKSSASHSWMYFLSDIYACFSRTSGLVRTGRLSTTEYLRSMAAADVYAVWDWRDPMPLLWSWAELVKVRLR